MKRERATSIEIAPANDFHEFRGPKPSPASIFSKIWSFRKFGSMYNSSRLIRNSRCGQRRALISRQDQAMTYWSCLIYSDFNSGACAMAGRPRTSKTHHRRKPLSSNNYPSPGITLRCNHSTSHLNETWARRKALKSRQRAIFIDLEGRTPHQRQYFRKFCHFDTRGACTKVAG